MRTDVPHDEHAPSPTVVRDHECATEAVAHGRAQREAAVGARGTAGRRFPRSRPASPTSVHDAAPSPDRTAGLLAADVVTPGVRTGDRLRPGAFPEATARFQAGVGRTTQIQPGLTPA